MEGSGVVGVIVVNNFEGVLDLIILHLMLQALGTECEMLLPFVLPVIQLSTDVHQELHVYLLEDGLELWLAVLENSATMSHDLLRLFRNMPPLLGRLLHFNCNCLHSFHFFPESICERIEPQFNVHEFNVFPRSVSVTLH